jgi:hypothetical protein
VKTLCRQNGSRSLEQRCESDIIPCRIGFLVLTNLPELKQAISCQVRFIFCDPKLDEVLGGGLRPIAVRFGVGYPLLLGSSSEMSQEFTEERWIQANFRGGRAAYCQIEIRVTEAEASAMAHCSSRGSQSAAAHARQRKTRGE